MTEKEKIEYAKSFIDKMANGINPLDDSEIPEGDLLNNIRISRCLFYVSDLLKEHVDLLEEKENKEKQPDKPKRERKPRLPKLTSADLTKIDFSAFPISDAPITPSILKNAIADFLMPYGKRLPSNAISNWLLSKGYLEIVVETDSDGKSTNRRVVTEKGSNIGLKSAMRHAANGALYRTYEIDKNAQSIIIDNLGEALNIEPAEEEKDEWPDNDIDYLKRYAKYVGVHRAAITLGRSVEEIRAKLDELNIVIE